MRHEPDQRLALVSRPAVVTRAQDETEMCYFSRRTGKFEEEREPETQREGRERGRKDRGGEEGRKTEETTKTNR